MIRKIKPAVRIFVEGQTEYNYFGGVGKQTELAFKIESIDMKGGGYSNFLKQIKIKGHKGYTVIFVIVDLDNVHGDRSNFEKLVNYCNEINKKSEVSYFLIGSYDDFEYFACLHSEEYKSGATDQFILKNFGYRNVGDFKANNEIFNFLNSNGKSKEIALSKLRKKENYVKNDFSPPIKKSGDIKIRNKRIVLNEDFEGHKNSNMPDFFDIIEKSV